MEEKKEEREYDYLYVTVRSDKRDELVDCYDKFRWEPDGDGNARRRGRYVDMTFRRDHRIPNKDAVVLLQVYLEEAINDEGKYEKMPTPGATAFAVFFSIAIAAILALCIVTLATMDALVLIVLAWILIVLAVLLIPCCVLLALRMARTEKKRDRKKLETARIYKKRICDNAPSVFEGGAIRDERLPSVSELEAGEVSDEQ